MKIDADGFSFDFTDAKDVFVFDEKDQLKPRYHGLSYAMKAVDIIVELENDYLFIEVKDFNAPDDYDFKSAIDYEQQKDRKEKFNHLREILKHKYRDTWIYRWAEEKVDKPIRYLCLLTLENGLLSILNKELKQQIPLNQATLRWKTEIARSCAVMNLDRWNTNFPKWPVIRTAARA